MNKRSLPTTPRVFQMYIDGQFTDAASGETITRHSPAHGVPEIGRASCRERVF